MKNNFIKRIKSFFKPQPIGIIVNNGNDMVDVSSISKPDPDRLTVKYKPYMTSYLFVGIERSKDNKVLHRFKDQQTKKEFVLSEELSRLLFYRIS